MGRKDVIPCHVVQHLPDRLQRRALSVRVESSQGTLEIKRRDCLDHTNKVEKTPQSSICVSVMPV